MRIYIGHDSREQAAYEVAAKTAREFGCEPIPLYERRLRDAGLFYRPVDRRKAIYDLNSGVRQSTDFAVCRFAVPLLAHSGWCLFVDCDVVFLRDPHELERMRDETKAVMVVKHPVLDGATDKMDGQMQRFYPRKNWSSVAYWNCDHPANRRLNLGILNDWHRDDLHSFCWLADSEIGELPAEWNWLVGVREKPAKPAIAHFTLGTPAIRGYENRQYSEIWMQASQR